ncbi:MAG TPA: hypothetical protein VGR25_03985 [bacterium]|jgi:hypothetical protein|nr:hypothetical protein [bacterium]
MLTLWSELPRPRTVEVTADLTTAAWLGVWLIAAWRVYDRLASLAAGVGQIRDGGLALESAGAHLGEALAVVPVIGKSAGEVVRLAFAGTAAPFIVAGSSLEGLITFIAWLLALLVLALPAGFWLNRYLPWRLRRVLTLQAAHRVIRADPARPVSEVQRLLASRALHRLTYAELRVYSPDPFGDWLAGRFDRLARAELASVGLRLR